MLPRGNGPGLGGILDVLCRHPWCILVPLSRVLGSLRAETWRLHQVGRAALSDAGRSNIRRLPRRQVGNRPACAAGVIGMRELDRGGVIADVPGAEPRALCMIPASSSSDAQLAKSVSTVSSAFSIGNTLALGTPTPRTKLRTARRHWVLVLLEALLLFQEVGLGFLLEQNTLLLCGSVGSVQLVHSVLRLPGQIDRRLEVLRQVSIALPPARPRQGRLVRILVCHHSTVGTRPQLPLAVVLARPCSAAPRLPPIRL